jgi:hypothetical protein
MAATQEIQNHFPVPRTVSIHRKGCRQEIANAERELGAFLKAVQSLYGDATAARAAADWISILESAPVTAFRGLPNWRHVKVRASSRLAISHLCYKSQDSRQMEGNNAD